MSLLANLFRSLILTILLSFLAPIAVLGLIYSCLYIFSYLPLLSHFGQNGLNQIAEFLLIFGNGSIVGGAITIGCACAIVGGLFNLFNYYSMLSN